MVDRYVPQLARYKGEKVCAIPELRRFTSKQAQIKLMDKSGGLQRVPGNLVPQIMGCQTPEIRIHCCDQLVASLDLSFTPPRQQYFQFRPSSIILHHY